MSWSNSVTTQYTILQSQLDPPIPLTESVSQADDGTLYFAMQAVSRMISLLMSSPSHKYLLETSHGILAN